jgi:hypothetical protein
VLAFGGFSDEYTAEHDGMKLRVLELEQENKELKEKIEKQEVENNKKIDTLIEITGFQGDRTTITERIKLNDKYKEI